MIKTPDAFFRAKSYVFRAASRAFINVFPADFYAVHKFFAVFAIKNYSDRLCFCRTFRHKLTKVISTLNPSTGSG